MLPRKATPFTVSSLIFCLISVGRALSFIPVDSRCQNRHLQRPTSLKSHNKNDADNGRCSSCQLDRRTALSIASASIFAATLFNPIHAFAADSDTPLAPITHKVYFDVRISRSDGTFYERDDLPDIQENKVFYGKLKFGLFGKTVPTAVERFLSYVDVPYSPLDDDPLPSYGRSSFKSLDQSTGTNGTSTRD